MVSRLVTGWCGFTLLCCSLTLQAETLRIGLANFEPYFSADGKSGAFVEILDNIFSRMPDYQVEYVPNLSNRRLLSDLSSGNINGAANIFAGQSVKGCVTDPVFRFQDVVISLREQQLEVDSLIDLEGLRVVAYQGASLFLGEAYQQVVRHKSERYLEMANQHLQAKMLLGKRVDLSVGDRYIFAGEAIRLGRTRADFNYHPIFPLTYSHVAFERDELCSEFNKALSSSVASGDYDRIYRTTLGDIEQRFANNGRLSDDVRY